MAARGVVTVGAVGAVGAVGVNVAAIPVEALGAGQYTVELVRALARREELALTLVARRDDASRWRGIAPRAHLLAVAPARRSARVVWEGLGLTATVRRRSRLFGVLHGPHYSLPPLAGCPSVVTVHDLTFVDHPEWHERAKVHYFRRSLRLAARRADVVICVSRRTAERYRELFRPTVPVLVVPHGVDHERFAPQEPTAGHDAQALERLGVHAPYVLHTGTIQPRKDLATLVAAFDLVAVTAPELQLVLAGGAGWGTEALDAAIRRSHHARRIVRLGHVGDGDIPSLVRRAAVAAYPSLEEGFGLPALEALACATPLVTTEDSAMSALADGAALLVPPSSPPELAAALKTGLAGGAEAEKRTARGLTVAAGYTWAACAEGHLEAYRLAAAR